MSFPLEPDAQALRAMTDAVSRFVVEHVASLAQQPSFDLDGAEFVKRGFVSPVPEHGRPLEEILERLAPAVAKSFNTAGPGYLAFIPGGGIYAAALADFIACAVNRYVGVRVAAPALVQIEETAVRWMADLMGYPAGASGILTTGGSLSNLSAIVTARAERLHEDELSRGVLYVSEETHRCVAKAARIAGFPARNVREVACDARWRMLPDALETEVRADHARGLRPFLVVPSVGTTNTGAIDPLPGILEVARRHGLWVHADAAYGGLFRIVENGERLMPGLEQCDSITLDPHKCLFLPYGTGCLLVRDGRALQRAHADSAHYLQDVVEADAPGFNELSPELSRDFRGLRLWLPLQLHGLAPFREALQEKLDLTRWAWEALRRDDRFEILDEPQLSVIAFRLKGEGRAADARNEELLRRVNARRRVFLSSTRMRGRYLLRLCVVSFRTHADRVEDAVEALREEAAALRVPA
jgi:aromatic-L-amino-acid decarboxylase